MHQVRISVDLSDAPKINTKNFFLNPSLIQNLFQNLGVLGCLFVSSTKTLNIFSTKVPLKIPATFPRQISSQISRPNIQNQIPKSRSEKENLTLPAWAAFGPTSPPLPRLHQPKPAPPSGRSPPASPPSWPISPVPSGPAERPTRPLRPASFLLPR